MRPGLPPAVQQLVDQLTPADGPQLIFDRGQLAHTMHDVAAAARAADLRVLFACKSFPHPEVLALAAAHLDGFDVASPAELAAVHPLLTARHTLSLTDPTCRATFALHARGAERTERDGLTRIGNSGATRLDDRGAALPDAVAALDGNALASSPLLSCESPEHLARALAAAPHAHLAARLSSSLLGRDRAVGAIQSGDGHHRSRFGLDVDPARAAAALAAMAATAAAHQRPLGLHLHHSGVVPTSTARFLDDARAALGLAAAAGVAPAFLNLGGAWHGVAATLAATWRDLAAAVRAEARAAFPAAPAPLPLLVEPGRLFARDAGFALGWVQAARTLDDRELRVLDLSRVCHLRWSQPALVAAAPRPGHARKLTLAGPTCYEDDLLGEWLVDDAHAYAPGAPVVLRDVTGYAVAWNAPFAGIPAAAVRLVG